MERIGQINRYVCSDCKHSDLTINLNSGTTPFAVLCRKCNGHAQSSMYRVQTNVSNAVTMAFYRPTPQEFQKLEIEGQQWVRSGCLLLAPLSQALSVAIPEDPGFVNLKGPEVLSELQRMYSEPSDK